MVAEKKPTIEYRGNKKETGADSEEKKGLVTKAKKLIQTAVENTKVIKGITGLSPEQEREASKLLEFDDVTLGEDVSNPDDAETGSQYLLKLLETQREAEESAFRKRTTGTPKPAEPRPEEPQEVLTETSEPEPDDEKETPKTPKKTFTLNSLKQPEWEGKGFFGTAGAWLKRNIPTRRKDLFQQTEEEVTSHKKAFTTLTKHETQRDELEASLRELEATPESNLTARMEELFGADDDESMGIARKEAQKIKASKEAEVKSKLREVKHQLNYYSTEEKRAKDKEELIKAQEAAEKRLDFLIIERIQFDLNCWPKIVKDLETAQELLNKTEADIEKFNRNIEKLQGLLKEEGRDAPDELQKESIKATIESFKSIVKRNEEAKKETQGEIEKTEVMIGKYKNLAKGLVKKLTVNTIIENIKADKEANQEVLLPHLSLEQVAQIAKSDEAKDLLWDLIPVEKRQEWARSLDAKTAKQEIEADQKIVPLLSAKQIYETMKDLDLNKVIIDNWHPNQEDQFKATLNIEKAVKSVIKDRTKLPKEAFIVDLDEFDISTYTEDESRSWNLDELHEYLDEVDDFRTLNKQAKLTPDERNNITRSAIKPFLGFNNPTAQLNPQENAIINSKIDDFNNGHEFELPKSGKNPTKGREKTNFGQAVEKYNKKNKNKLKPTSKEARKKYGRVMTDLKIKKLLKAQGKKYVKS